MTGLDEQFDSISRTLDVMRHRGEEFKRFEASLKELNQTLVNLLSHKEAEAPADMTAAIGKAIAEAMRQMPAPKVTVNVPEAKAAQVDANQIIDIALVREGNKLSRLVVTKRTAFKA